MKRILFLLFLFALSINVILAQVATINIVTPNSSGLSNNQVVSFDVNSDGTILNNSASDGTAQLGGTAVTANSNITTGSEADLILFQVTGSSGSGLEGTIEVFGGEAGLIIANPNGIDCDGCGFINTSKVDLVTGTANFSGDDLTGFSIDGSSTLTVSGSGFLSDAVADELKLESQNISINAQVKANNSLEIIVNDYTQSGTIDVIGDISIQVTSEASLDDNASIKARNLFFSAYDLYNQAGITITENATFDLENDFKNGFSLDGTNYDGGDIIVNNFNVTAGRDFLNYASTTIDAATVTIEVTNFDGDITNTGTVSSDSLNFILNDDFTYNGGDFNGFTFNNLAITTDGYFSNRGDLTVNNFNVTAGNFFYNYGLINANSFNVTTGTYFYNYNATINADNFNVVAEGSFYNDYLSTIIADNFNVVADSFKNYVTIIADNFNVVADSFGNYSATINTNSFNVTADGFYYSGDLDFELAANDSLTVLGSAFVDVTNFNNHGTVVADSLRITAENFASNIYNTGTISSDSLNLILTDDFIHQSISFNGFSFNNLGINTGGDFTNRHALNVSGALTITVAGFDANISNDSTISSDSLNLITSSNFTLLSNTFDDFTFNSLAITANNYTQGAAIDIAGDLSIQASGEASLDDNASIKARNLFFSAYDLSNQADITITDNATFDIENDFFNGFNLDGTGYAGGDIIANDFNVTAGNDFLNLYNAIISADNFNVTAGNNFLNGRAEISADSFTVTAGANFYNRDSATINADNFNVTAGDDFSNFFDVTINANDFTVTAGNRFFNGTSSTINADTVTIEVTNFDDDIYNYNSATISTDSLNFILTDDFTHESTTLNNFTFNNLAFTIAGDYTQIVAIDIAGDLSIQVSGEASLDDNASIKARNLFFSAYDLWSQADITITENATFDVANDFLNGFRLSGTDYDGGDIIADNFNVTAGNNFINRYNATINAGSFNVTAGGRFRNLNEATINADSFDVTAGTDFGNEVGGIINADNFNVTTGTYFTNEYSSMINADSFNVTTGTYFTNQYGAGIFADNFNVTTEKDFANQYSFYGTNQISADNFSVTAGGNFYYYGDLDFELAANDSLTVLGDAFVDVTNFNNHGTVSADSLSITAENFAANIDNTGTISSYSLNLITSGDFIHESDSLENFTFNNLAITANNYTQGAAIDIAGDISIQVSGEASLDDNAFIKAKNIFFSAYDLSNRADITIADNATFELENDFKNGFDLDGTGYGGGDIIAGNFNVTAGNHFISRYSATISADSFTVTAENNFFSRSSVMINADDFNVTVGGDFQNRDSGTINAGSFNVTTGTYFSNDSRSMINADSFIVTTGTYFSNENNSTINTNIFNVTAGYDFANKNSSKINADSFNVTAGDDFANKNDATIDADTVTIEVTNFADDIFNTATISSDSLNLILTDNFTHNSTSFNGFTFNNLGVYTDGSFTNEADLTVNNFNVTAGDDFSNSATINADTVTIEVTNFANDISNTAIVLSDSLNFILTNNFTRKDNSFSGFTFNNLGVYTDGLFRNEADLTVNNFNVTAVGDFGNYTASINANYFTVRAGGDFYNRNNATINTNWFTVRAGRDFFNDNNSTINADTFINVTAGRDFINKLSSATTTNNFNVTAGDDFLNDNSTINADDFSVTVLGDDFGNYQASINANDFNVTAKDDFYNRNYSTINSNDFYVRAGVDFFNDNNSAINADNFNVNVTAGRDFINKLSSMIHANSFNATAEDDFLNQSNSTINADTVTIEVTNFSDDISNTGTVVSTSLNFILTDSFTHNSNSFTNFNNFSNLAITTEGSFTNEADLIVNNFNVTAGGDFTTNTDIVLTGNLGITANSFNNSNTISADNLSVVVSDHFINNASTLKGNDVYIQAANYITNNNNTTIEAAGILTISTYQFSNTGSSTIEADSLDINTYQFSNTGSSTIEADNLDINTYQFSNTGSSTIEADNLSIVVGDHLTNQSNSIIKGNNVSIDAARYVLNSSNATIEAADILTIETDILYNVAAGAKVINSDIGGNIIAANLTIETGKFNNINTDGDINGTITADSLNLSVAGDFDYVDRGTITTNSFNLSVGGDFSYNDTNSNFVWNENYNLTVFENSDIVAKNFENRGVFNVGDLNIAAADDFDNYATIDAENFNVTVVETFNNRSSATINADSFNATVDDFFNRSSATITANECNIIHTALYSDQGTITCTEVINIARPDANGLSNNIYTEFNIFRDGIVFNNSDSTGISKLAGSILANTNYSAGDAASLILAQITGNYISLLEGTLEVFGAEAGVIIANPNGITCNGCNFINASRVDLVTGNYDVNTGTYGVIAATDITIGSNGVDAFVDVLNIQTNNFTNGGTVSTDTLNLSVADSFINNGSIIADTFSLSIAGDFDYAADFLNNGTITADNLNFTARNGVFNNDTTIDLAAGSLGITANSFTNTGGVVNADTFALSVAGDFDYAADFINNGTITADNLNFTARNGIFNNDTTIDLAAGSLGITANSFTNTGGVVIADTFALSVAGDFDYATDYLNNGNINANSLDLQVGDEFTYNYASNDFTWNAQNSLVVLGTASVTADSFNNSGIITANSFDITATDFTNAGEISATTTLNTTVSSTLSGSFNNTVGVVNADTFNLSVAGDFDDTKKGIINANYFNLTSGGSFINDNTNDDFVLGENESLIISGDFIIATNNYIQFGTLEVDGTLDIDAEKNFANSGSITVTGALDIDAEGNFSNSGSITTDSLEITAGYTVINQGSIVSNSLDLTADDFFRNLTGDISVDTLTIIAGGKVTNTANITVGTLTITANNDSARTDDPAGAFFYVSNRGNITADIFNITAVDNFYNRGNITATDFNITRAKDIFFLNKEIDSFYAAGNIYDGGTISLNGDSSFIAAGSIENYGNIISLNGDSSFIAAGSIENYGNIDLGSNNLDISADSFINYSGANVTADTLNLDVSSFVQRGVIDATINQ